MAQKPQKQGPKVKVYSTPTCPYCYMAKDFLKENGIAFEDINVAEDHAAAHEMIEKSGQMGVPVIDINGTIIVGFDREAVKKALGIK
ncbi:MAG TPA: glutaredoxin domain-containing protein [archaeon]|jgi:glutaredoxin-like YruB-family protein|nr:glutaredoxin domain-containing protein [archaeon]